jgi:hypothetical protein
MHGVGAGLQHRATSARPFMAIQGQWAQLLQVALLPAVGASMKRLPGLSVRSLCIMPLSVATMNSGVHLAARP